MAGTPLVEPTGSRCVPRRLTGVREPSPHVSGGRRRLIPLLLIAAGVLAAAVVCLWTRNDPFRGAHWVAAEHRTIAPALHELGWVVARNETTVFTQFTGEIIWLIEEGALVAPGTVIVRFDATKTQESVELMQKDLLDRKVAVRDAKREVNLERRRGELEVAQMEAKLMKEKLNREEIYSHPTDEEKREAELDLKTAQLRVEQAQRDYDAYARLYEAGYASRSTFNQKQLKLATQNAELAKAKVLHHLVLQGSTVEAKRLADLAVAEAEKNLATARFDAEADNTIANAELQLAQISLDIFERSLRKELEDLENASVKAPVAGRVAFVEVYKGSNSSKSPVQLGETRSEGQDLCRIADTSALQIRTVVSEIDANRLRLGQEAEVRLTAQPEHGYRARVASVALVAKDKNAAISRLALQHSGEAFVNVVGVLLDFEALTPAELEALRLGLTVSVTMRLSEPRMAVVLPWTAVRLRDDGTPEVSTRGGPQVVRLGESDETHVEILEGVAEGEEVRDFRLPGEAGVARNRGGKL